MMPENITCKTSSSKTRGNNLSEYTPETKSAIN